MVGDLPNASSQQLERARLLEKQGRPEEAARLFLQAGALVESARVLARMNRFADSAKLLIQASGISSPGAPIDEQRQKLAITAAKLFARAGDSEAAAQVLKMLEERRSVSQSLAAERRAPIQLTQEVTAPPASENPFELGSIIAGRYRLESRLGEGGIGIVFRASDLELGETIAVKIFAQATHDPQAAFNFRQELKLTRQLTHPNVIRLFDIGVHSGHRFITMELLVGRDVKSMLRRPLEISKGLGYLVQACAGLQAAHDQGVIHRDVKPENLFVVESGVLKVMDFGIAKQNDTSAIAAGQIAGTPEYVAPEQIQQFASVGPSADLYALGAVAYEMFTATPPFRERDLQALLRAHREQTPEPPSARNPDLPRELDEVILKLLEKAPARRYASCRQLAAALEPIRQRYAVEEFF